MSPALVLLVEDEFLIQDLIETSLRDAGYTVETASNGQEAIDLIADKPQDRDALVTDVNLGPGPNGWAVARAARAANPTISVVYLTGDSGHQYEVEGVPHSAIILKPFVGIDVVVALARLKAERDSAPRPA